VELQQLYDLMERFARSGLTELEWRNKDEEIALRRAPAPIVPAVPVAAAGAVPAAAQPEVVSAPKIEEGDWVKAPLVGTFYAAPAPGEAPFVVPGKQVKKGDTLCLIEAMKMMSEVPAPADCVIEEVLGRDGEAVGYGEPLFRIRKV
jgi:acetyl-CoA carboxylase biotin carboxyl carrier protein